MNGSALYGRALLSLCLAISPRWCETGRKSGQHKMSWISSQLTGCESMYIYSLFICWNIPERHLNSVQTSERSNIYNLFCERFPCWCRASDERKTMLESLTETMEKKRTSTAFRSKSLQEMSRKCFHSMKYKSCSAAAVAPAAVTWVWKNHVKEGTKRNKFSLKLHF